MKEIKVIGMIDGKKIILSILKAAKKVCEKQDFSADERIVAEAFVLEVTTEFLEDLAKETKEVERDEPSDILDELLEGIVNMISGGGDDE